MSLFPDSNPGILTAIRSKNFQKLFRSAETNKDGHMLIGPKKIYILPTRFGLMFGALIIAMLLGSINYANNLGYLLTFFLASIGILAMNQTWYNLLNLDIAFLPVKPVYAGQHFELDVHINNYHNRARGAIQLYSKSGKDVISHDINADSSVLFTPSFSASKRGWFSVNDLVLSTQYPFGLFRAWVYLKTDIRVLVYPKPASKWDVPRTAVYTLSAQGNKGIGSDDFVSHRNYRHTDSPKQIDWKIFAREKGLMTKQFGGDRNEQLWLSLDLLPDVPLEISLSMLTRAIIDADNENVEYGLKLPKQVLPLGQGIQHKADCLRALALFGIKAGDE
jgi:uncharacterized protein (DUF58 family)